MFCHYPHRTWTFEWCANDLVREKLTIIGGQFILPYFVAAAVLNAIRPLLLCPIHVTILGIVVSHQTTIYFLNNPTQFWIKPLNLVNSHLSKITEHVYLGINHCLPDALGNCWAQITVANWSATTVKDVIHGEKGRLKDNAGGVGVSRGQERQWWRQIFQSLTQWPQQ